MVWKQSRLLKQRHAFSLTVVCYTNGHLRLLLLTLSTAGHFSNIKIKLVIDMKAKSKHIPYYKS